MIDFKESGGYVSQEANYTRASSRSEVYHRGKAALIFFGLPLLPCEHDVWMQASRIRIVSTHRN